MYKSNELEVNKLLMEVLQKNASDLHLVPGKPPTLRVESVLVELEEYGVLSGAMIGTMIDVVLGNEARRKQFREELEVDFSYSYKDNVRFRGNAYMSKGSPALALRLIPNKIRTIEELNLPNQIANFASNPQGLVLVVGPTGHGKSTTLASMIDLVNHTRAANIVTIEDPIEFIYTQDKCLISQREVGVDTHSFPRALKSVLREDINVILVGEMRDLESISTTITLAETGHLVFATLHTNDAAQTIDRIIDVFDSYQQAQIRAQLSNVLLGVVSQRLLPRVGGGRIPALEIMTNNNAISNIIREGKTHQIPNTIHTSGGDGMVSMDRYLANLVSQGQVKMEDALPYTADQSLFRGLLKV
jgi:twitching motility protein PilT